VRNLSLRVANQEMALEERVQEEDPLSAIEIELVFKLWLLMISL
jgi:hypothetical protein